MLPRNDANQGQEWKANKNRTYTNRETGETISRRQYDKRFGVLAEHGFESYEARAKASKYIVKKFPKAKSVHHEYDLGLPNDIKAAIRHTIDISPHFGTKMMLVFNLAEYIDYERTRKGKKEKRHVNQFASPVIGKYHYNIDYMFSEVDESMNDYGVDWEVTNYTLVLIDSL